MKIDNRYIGKLLLLVLLLAIKGNLFAQNSGYDDQGKEILSKDTPRRALVAPDCIVDTMWDLVSVAGEENGMNNFLDSDLNNSVKLRSLLDVDAIESELIRVKDRKHVYEKGTPVGFSLEISGGLLDLSVLKIFNILYYYKGELVGSATASDGGEGGGLLDLNLIQLSSDAATMITATDPNNFKGEYFDEIGLAVGGLDVDLLSSLGIRYAFAGAVQEVTLTQNNETDLGPVWIVTGGGWLGTEYTYNVSSSDHFIDEDLNNTTPAAVSDLVGSSITVKWEKTFPAGTEVGFLYSKTELLTVGLGKVGSITLYDENGDETEEIVLNASVIGLGLLKSEKHASSVIASKPFCQARFRFTGGLKLSETTYYYGFLREAPIIPQSCQITDLAMDATICDNETTYQLSPTEGVKWSLEKVTADKAGNEILDVSEKEKGKVEISEEGKVTGISPDVEGYYHFKAAVNEAGCEGWFVLRHGVQASTGSCNDPVKGSEYDLAPARNAEGGIMILNNIKNRNNIIDDDPNNYAEIQPGITLLSNDFVVGVQKKDGIISDGQESKRVGFLVDIPTSLLDVNALQFFYIKLYNEGKPVGKNTYTVEDWNVISAGLIGSEKASKTRLGVTVPSDVVFDEFSLWTGGVASIRLSALRIYGALVENGSDECDNPLLGCDDAVIVGDGALDKAYINYDRTGFPALTNLGVGLYGLENLLSGEFDPSKYAYSYTTLDVAGTMQISIKFGRTLTPNHQVGFVVDKKTFLGNVGVIGVTQIKSYYSGSSNPDEPVDEKSDWSVLGADVIGYGDYAYLMFKPNAKFDEIQLITASGVGLLNSTKVYSVFIRTDADGDGIPDCMDPTPCDGDISNMEITSDVCVGDEVVLYGIANFGEGETKTYTVKAKNIDDNSEILINSGFTVSQGDFKLDFVIEKAGRYTITFTTEDNEILTWPQVIVHPLETTWKPTSSSTDWNTWDNWSAGSPWTCTDVIIPTDASVYPVLESGVMNGCRYIHFEPNTEVVKTHYLTYTKAWVEIELRPDRYYMVSAPLKGIYSGDWFIAKNDEVARSKEFQVWNESSYPENRINPTIYQRVWEAASANRLANGGYEGVYPNVTKTNWTKPFNLLSTEYNKNEGYDFNALSVWVHPFAPNETTEAPTDQAPYVFRFPKEHTKYYYYDENGVIQSPSETLKRENTGRFIYEDADSKLSGFPYYMKVRNIKTGDGHNVYLVGNPFMAHIDVEKFLKENETLITSVKVYNGNTNTNVIANPDGGGILVSDSESKEYEYIAPMQSFFVTMTTETPTGIILPDYCEVKFTEEMLVGKAGNNLKSAISDSDKSGNDIRISAEAEGKKAGTLLRFTAEANDNFRDREDSEVLIEDEVPPTVAVFTVAEDYALDIQQRRNGGNIPLGLYMAKPADVTLRIDIPEEYSGWVVEDMETKRVYALQPGKENELQLGRMTTNVGRFYLKGASLTGNEVISASQPKISCYMESGSGKLKVRSYDGIMERCEVYSIDGSLRSVAKFDSDEYSFPAYKGVNVVKVCFKDGIQTVRKVACF